MIHRLIALLLCLTIGDRVLANDLSNTFDEKQLGYYAFEKAQRNELPPRVRPPPYRQMNVPCPGMLNDKYLDNKDTLCGDLNRGYVPLNPMNLVIQNQHYPFELIKNKTLHFLARTLPYLKEDHENIPKVFKIAQADTGFNELYSNAEASPPTTNYRSKRQISKATITKLEKSELHPSDSAKNSPQNASSPTKKNKAVDSDPAPLQQESRQKGCEQNDGIMCHIVQALTTNSKASSDSGGLFNTIYNTYQAYQTYKTHSQNLNNFMQSLTNPIDNKSDNGNEKTGNDQYSTRPIFSQMLSAFNSMGNSQTSTTASPATYSANGNGNFNNPLGALFDYFGSTNGGSRKKSKPSEYEEYLNGLTAASSSVQPTVAKAEDQIQVAQPTPTACPSIEEYVTPVYARNYQGVWKYVVQIPHEGYFTQTLQKTSCVKNKCDYMDGACKEASRWVSLLVAEVYYPNAKQPLSTILPQSSQLKPTAYNTLNNLQNVNELASKLNGPHLPSSTAAAFATDPNLVNYDLFNSLLPTSYSPEYNHYDQTFARRASKNHQTTSQATNPKLNYPAVLSTAASYSMPQYQELFNQYNPEFNLNNLNNQYLAAYQPNYNQQPLVSAQQFAAAPTKQSKTLTPAQAQIQQLVDLYQQQYLKQAYLAQLAKSSKSNGNNVYSGLIDGLNPAASMIYPTVVSQSPSVGLPAGSQAINLPQQSMIGGKLLNDPKQNEIKPRSFDAVNSHKILESTLMKSSYINEEAAASNGDKIISNDSNQPADLNGMGNNANGNGMNSMNNQAASPGGQNTEANENGGSKESSEECDGYDTNGCYVIRVYYDWFLVNGSCKCWKTNSKTGSLETLRKMLYGK